MKRGEVMLKSIGAKGATLALSVPARLVVEHDLKPGMVFVPEVTDDGILFRARDNYPGEDRRPRWRR